MRGFLRGGRGATGAAATLAGVMASMILLEGCPPAGEVESLEDAWEELHSSTTSGCSGVVPPDSGPFGMKVALTFDDGTDLTDTPRVLDVLAAHGAKGTFFVNGRQIDSDQDRALLDRMVQEGHLVANHSQNHVNSVNVSLDSWRDEVEQTHAILADILGDHVQVPTYFRFPYGSADCSTHGIVTDLGYRVVGWHIDSADWCFQSSSGGVGYCSPSTFAYVPDAYRGDFVGFTLHQAAARDGGILLFHDVHSYTVESLDAVLTALEDNGYGFTTLDDVETFPRLHGITPPRGPWIGDPCSTNGDCDFSADGMFGHCHTWVDPAEEEDHGFCALTCDGYCPDLADTAPTFCVSTPDEEAGMCVSRSDELNEYCEAIPGTAEVVEQRYVDTSGAAASEAVVCNAPEVSTEP